AKNSNLRFCRYLAAFSMPQPLVLALTRRCDLDHTIWVSTRLIIASYAGHPEHGLLPGWGISWQKDAFPSSLSAARLAASAWSSVRRMYWRSLRPSIQRDIIRRTSCTRKNAVVAICAECTARILQFTEQKLRRRAEVKSESRSPWSSDGNSLHRRRSCLLRRRAGGRSEVCRGLSHHAIDRSSRAFCSASTDSRRKLHSD